MKRRAKLFRKKKIGLALGSGAVRGLAHIGVLEVLEEEDIPVNLIAGTSAGAAIGALYAQGKDSHRIGALALEVGWKRLAPLTDLTLPKTGFIQGRKLKEFMKRTMGDVDFADLKIPLACVATDIMTGEEVVINEGSVLEAVRASISIPVIFTVVKWQNRSLVDGGLVNPVPVSVLKQMGADIIIAVNVIPEPVVRARRGGEFKKLNIINVMVQSVYIGSYLLIEHCLEGADIVIEPQVAHIGFGEFHQAQELISLGAQAAQDALPEIKKRC
jgi:NTE family protein